jgi:hypothetical protein
MMSGFTSILLLYSLLVLMMVLGFAYIIWIMSVKESGNAKLPGQIVSIVIVVLSLLLFLLGITYGGQMRSKMKGCPMMGSGMMEGKGSQKMMEMMKKNPEMGKKMMKMMEEKTK